MLKTLIVDDNRNWTGNHSSLFIHKTFPSIIVQEAIDGKEVMQKVDWFQPNLIIMDIRLPDESGLQLTKQIKVTNPNVRVLI